MYNIYRCIYIDDSSHLAWDCIPIGCRVEQAEEDGLQQSVQVPDPRGRVAGQIEHLLENSGFR